MRKCKFTLEDNATERAKYGFAMEDIAPEHYIELLNIYFNEWCHRDTLLWQQVFKFFYATIVVLFLPNMASFMQIDLPNFPNILFPVVSLLMSLMFLYVSLGYAKRLEAIEEMYYDLIRLMPNELQSVSPDSRIRSRKLFTKRLSITICIVMFGAVWFLSAVMLGYYIDF